MADETKPALKNESGVAPRGGNSVGEVSTLIQSTIGELERMLDARHVVSEPLTFEGATVIPLVSLGFGFGAGAGAGGGRDAKGDSGEGGGGGGGGGGGVKPLAVLIIEKGGVRLEPIPEPPSGFDKLGTAIAGVLDQRGEEKKKKKKDDD